MSCVSEINDVIIKTA